MRRYASIDFLRGFAIFLMIFLHTFMRWLDVDGFVGTVGSGEAPLSLLLLMVILLFLGSWAGFFLMVSALGNMISMYKGLAKGSNVKGLVSKQIIGGIILLIFAYLTEGLIGYHGTLGEALAGNAHYFDSWLWRGYHMETIHAVAWCVILNGIVQGILSKNDGWKNINRNIKIYAVLAIIVIAMTMFVWLGFDAMVPDGDFSHGIDPLTGNPWQYGHLLNQDILTNIFRVFAQPWVGQVEPLFPFLAVSFIGSIIGLYLMKLETEPKPIKTKPIKRGMQLGFIIFIVGLLAVLIGLLFAAGDIFDNILLLLRNGYDVTAVEGAFGMLWLPYFLTVTGAQIAAILLLFRLVEFRGKGDEFADKTTFFRRFGFVAFSVYNFQFIDVIVIALLSLIPGMPAFGMNKLDPISIWIAIIGILALWYIVLALWEKADYAFGLEWCIAKISYILIPSKKPEGEERLPWWKTSRLDPQAALHKAEWINIISKDEIDHENLKESKLAYKLSLCGFAFPACFPLGFSIGKSSIETEKENKYNKRAILIGLLGLIFFIILIILLSVLTTGILF